MVELGAIFYQKRVGVADSLRGCRVGGSRERSGAAVGREPAGRSPKRRCFFLFGAVGAAGGSYPQVGYPKAHRSPSDSMILLRFKIRGSANPQKTKGNCLEK